VFPFPCEVIQDFTPLISNAYETKFLRIPMLPFLLSNLKIPPLTVPDTIIKKTTIVKWNPMKL